MTNAEALDYLVVDESNIDFKANTVTLTVPVEWMEHVKKVIRKQMPAEPKMVSEFGRYGAKRPTCPSCGRLIDRNAANLLPICVCGQRLKAR